MESIMNQAKQLEAEIVAHRRWLHSHAEVGFDLPQTTQYVKEALENMGINSKPCGKSGLVATIGGKNGGKTILLRADMDALPIPEESAEAFSCPEGAMHACGHDFHTAMLLGAAKLLKAQEESLPGTVKLMFQPAEEILEGAHDMIEAGVLEDPKPDAALMIHVTVASPLPAGMMVVCAPGVSAPAADYFTIQVQGSGCHGSTPQNGVDALNIASHILIALQEIHARELAPREEAVLTIGTLHGGTAPNVIADSAQLAGTIRCYDEKVRSFLKQRMTEISESIAKAFRGQATVEFGSGCPTLVNDKALAQLCKQTLAAEISPQMVLSAADFPTPSRSGGSEDFAYISQKVPTLMLALSAGDSGKGYTVPLHHPKVRFDESALPYGTAAMTSCALAYLKQG